MITGSVVDYVGRQADILLFQPSGSVNAPVVAALITPEFSGLLTAGLQKLVQRFLLELLTPTGSMLYLPDRGSIFLIAARQGRWRSAADVEISFNQAKLAVQRNLLDDELDTDPADERFSNAVLEQVTFTPVEVGLRIRLTSQAGSDYTFLLPLPVSLTRPT